MIVKKNFNTERKKKINKKIHKKKQHNFFILFYYLFSKRIRFRRFRCDRTSSSTFLQFHTLVSNCLYGSSQISEEIINIRAIAAIKLVIAQQRVELLLRQLFVH